MKKVNTIVYCKKVSIMQLMRVADRVGSYAGGVAAKTICFSGPTLLFIGIPQAVEDAAVESIALTTADNNGKTQPI